MDDSAIVVKSRCFPDNLISSLQRLRYDGKFCDVTLKCSDFEFKAHKNVLASATEYFEAMFSNDTNEARTGIVDFSHIPTEAVKHCLDFMYSGHAEISAKTVQDMLNLSEMMQLNELARLCVEFLAERITLENCSEMIILSNLHCKECLTGKIGMFLSKCFPKFIDTDDFKSLTCDCLLHCLDLLECAVTGRMCEIWKWNGVLSWISYDPEQRKDKFLKLFRAIRLSCFSREFLKENVLSQRLVSESKECLMLTAMCDVTDGPYPALKKNSISKILYFGNGSQMIVQYEVKSGKWLPVIPFPGKLSAAVSVIYHNDCIYAGDGAKMYQLRRGRWNVVPPQIHNCLIEMRCRNCLKNQMHTPVNRRGTCFSRCIGIGDSVFMVTSNYIYEYEYTVENSMLTSHGLQECLPNQFFMTASEDQIFIMSNSGPDAFVFDLSNNVCVRIQSMLGPCPDGLALWYDQRVFTFCNHSEGSFVSLYDPKIDSWTIVPDVAISSVPKSFYYIGDKLYLTGESPEDICGQVDLDYLKSIQAKMEGRRYLTVTSN